MSSVFLINAANVANTVGKQAILTLQNRYPVWATYPRNNAPFSLSVNTLMQVGFPILGFQWQVLPGFNMLNYDISTYPFPNAEIAANSMLKKPITIKFSIIPSGSEIPGLLQNISGHSALTLGLKAFLEYWVESANTFRIFHAGGFLSDCLLQELTDVTPSDSTMIGGSMLQATFFQPIVSQNSASESLNNFANTIMEGGTPVTV